MFMAKFVAAKFVTVIFGSAGLASKGTLPGRALKLVEPVALDVRFGRV